MTQLYSMLWIAFCSLLLIVSSTNYDQKRTGRSSPRCRTRSPTGYLSDNFLHFALGLLSAQRKSGRADGRGAARVLATHPQLTVRATSPFIGTRCEYC
jgi:hypothetical protein